MVRSAGKISADPPRILEHHVRLPDQAAQLLHADEAHTQGFQGRGVRVAMIDSGFYPHPFFLERGYKITYIPTKKEPKPHTDQYGHGTAQLASLFSIAPEAEALVIKCMDRDPSLAIEKAISLRPDVLSCAWGFNIDHPGVQGVPPEYQSIERLILQAIDMGITIVAAGGNGQRAFPGSMPEVISAGGVYFSPQGRFEPSDIASEYESSIFPGRKIPDLCGLVGNRPFGRLLLVPVPPSARLAKRPGFSSIAAGDSEPLEKGKGWAMFSGTSASTAMISGAAALLRQAHPELTPEQTKRLLTEAARVEPESGQKVLTVSAAVRAALNSALTGGEESAQDPRKESSPGSR
jgi:serine protease AprX